MPLPRALTAGVFPDHVTEFNGPIYFIPGYYWFSSMWVP